MGPLRLPGRRSDPVTLYGNPVLRQPAVTVQTFDDSVLGLVDRLFETMYAIDTGVGLAANQIGCRERVFVFDCDGVVGHVINPVLETIGTRMQNGSEGCLSVPGLSLPTERHERARVVGQDAHGKPVRYSGEGLLARCFQHEVGHLDGRLYLDEHPKPVRDRIDAEIRQKDWFGTPALAPESRTYRRAQVEPEP